MIITELLSLMLKDSIGIILLMVRNLTTYWEIYSEVHLLVTLAEGFKIMQDNLHLKSRKEFIGNF